VKNRNRTMGQSRSTTPSDPPLRRHRDRQPATPLRVRRVVTQRVISVTISQGNCHVLLPSGPAALPTTSLPTAAALPTTALPAAAVPTASLPAAVLPRATTSSRLARCCRAHCLLTCCRRAHCLLTRCCRAHYCLAQRHHNCLLCPAAAHCGCPCNMALI
jgi:hypothetical protein